MIKYEFLRYIEFSAKYIKSLRDVYELVIDPHRFAYDHKYNIIQQPNKQPNNGVNFVQSFFEQSLFCCNDRYKLKIWMDLNGFKFNTCKIFYNSDGQIEYASIILGKE